MERLKELIKERDIAAILDRLFETNSVGLPHIRPGFRRESELWDFKRGLPGLRAEHEVVWADIATDVAAFHNSKGGVILFGIEDNTLNFVGTRDALDAKRFNDKIRRYLGDGVWVEFSREYIQSDQRYLGVAVVPPRNLLPLRMKSDAPLQGDSSRSFCSGDLAVREGDSTRVYRGLSADQYLAEHRLPASDTKFLVNDNRARILRPDWSQFILREALCPQVREALRDDRTFVTTLTGIGGIGKTALASWAVLEAYREKEYEFIVSVSAKDRELTERGLRPVDATLTSYDDLINELLTVLGFSELIAEQLTAREEAVRSLISGLSLLLFVDNLETVDDQRVGNFIETLPKPVKAITTSRTMSVRKAAFPVSVGPLTDTEAIKFFDHHAAVLGRTYLRNASETEKLRVIRACSAVPLAVQWLIGHSRDVESALRLADALNKSGVRDEELLEFCFRRVHVGLSPTAKAVLAALTLSEKPQAIEAVSVACGLALDAVDLGVEELQTSSLVEKVWDERTRDLSMRCLPITRRFAYRELQRNIGEEQRMRARLTEWYDGRDIEDEDRRRLIVDVRKGRKDPDIVLVDAAIAYRRQGRSDEAEKYFNQAIDRNPRSWRAHRELAELLRDGGRVGAALEEYSQAGMYAPAKGEDRARIFREWGMLLRTSGAPDAWRQAIDKFEMARLETPHDPVLLHALAYCYVKQGSYKKAEPILEQLVRSQSPETRARSYDLLQTCYQKLREPLKLAILKDEREADAAAKLVQPASKRTVKNSSRPLSAGISQIAKQRRKT